MEVKHFDILLHDAEVKLKRLKALYEQYFQGIERIEPLVPRKDLDRLFKTLHKERPRNTAARFKLNQLQASYNTYQTYWGRIARRIEEGTYERDVRRARRRRGGGADADDRQVKEFELDLDADSMSADDLFGEDEIASVLSALDARNSAPPPEPKSGGFSAFSPFARSDTSKVAPLPEREPLPADDTQPNAVNPFASKPVTATFGKPKRDPQPARQKAGRACGTWISLRPRAHLARWTSVCGRWAGICCGHDASGRRCDAHVILVLLSVDFTRLAPRPRHRSR
ncbi:MAG: hypothetical protein VYE22_10530, partial [Myxococcota bacterium]|nr:hypothetical protein [Myxococcota bacterium]